MEMCLKLIYMAVEVNLKWRAGLAITYSTQYRVNLFILLNKKYHLLVRVGETHI